MTGNTGNGDAVREPKLGMAASDATTPVAGGAGDGDTGHDAAGLGQARLDQAGCGEYSVAGAKPENAKTPESVMPVMGLKPQMAMSKTVTR